MLSALLIISCIIFGACLTYLFISDISSHERMIFFLITIVAFFSTLSFALLIRDARRQEEDDGKK